MFLSEDKKIMNMKKKYFIPGLAVLSVLAITAGTSSVMAASTSTNSLLDKFKIHQKGQELTDAQKTEMKAKMDAVKSALEAGDYTAWVAAETAINADSPELKNVTSDNFSSYVEKYKERETKMAEQKTKIDAVETALTNSDYNAWVTAQKALDTNSPLLTKVTSDNFNKYAQANNLRKQADSIMKDLGINGAGRGNMGGFGGPGGGHGGMGGERPADAQQ